jgi:signal transduction histidine kinase/ActR/RegA family two-component response regulator
MIDAGTRGGWDRGLVRWFSEVSHHGVVATDGDLRVVLWNRWMEIHAGVAAGEAIGQPLVELFPELSDRGTIEYYQAAQRGEVSVISHGLHRHLFALPPTLPDLDGDTMPQSARIGPLWDGPVVIGTVTLIDDVSERLAAETELRRQIQAQRSAREAVEHALRAKDDFLSTLSHEIRQPLNAVLGWTRILRDRRDLEPELMTRALHIIDRNATLQARMIDDLLDMARIVSGKLQLDLQPVDLVSVIMAAVDVVTPASRARGVALTTTLNPSLPRVHGDHARLQQVVWNLLSNAVKFTDAGGTVNVRLSYSERTAAICVRDTGRGIATELLPHVFDRFRQGDASSARREGGLGLGLALVRELAELHGGRVIAESAGPGHGAAFTVSLPIDAEEMAADVRTGGGAVDERLLEGIRVLIVDDEGDARELIATTLTQCGATAVPVASSEAALAAMADSRPGERPDVLVADIGMPGEDGYTLIKRLRARGPELGGLIPAIAVTGYANPDDRRRVLAAGFQVHLAKPLDPRALCVAVADVVATRA